MRTFLLAILALLLGAGGGVLASRTEPAKSLIDRQIARFLPAPTPPALPQPAPLTLAAGETAFSAETLAPLGIEPCFPREPLIEASERPWLVREVNAAGLVARETLPPSPDLAAYPGLIKIEGIRSTLGTEREHCAAARIAPHWFLTAAHCLIDLDITTARPTYDVIAITPSDDVRREGTQLRSITGAVCHSAYGMNRQQYPNDIALFYLDDVSPFEAVAIARLETADMGLLPRDLTDTYVSGWGKNGGTRYLQGGPVIMAEVGEAVLIGDRVGPRGPNVGDSGAPLYATTLDGPLVIGTLSQVTQSAGEVGDRSIYIRTKTVHDWITRTMAICEQDGRYVCAPAPSDPPETPLGQ